MRDAALEQIARHEVEVLGYAYERMLVIQVEHLYWRAIDAGGRAELFEEAD